MGLRCHALPQAASCALVCRRASAGIWPCVKLVCRGLGTVMQASASEACTFCAHACLQGLNSYAYFYAADIVDGSLHPVNQRCSACVQGLLHACRSHTDPY